MRSHPRPAPRSFAALVSGVLGLAALISGLSGTVQVRACLPAAGASWLQGHLAFLVRGTQACPSGAAVDDGAALVVVGVLAVIPLFASMCGLAVLGAAVRVLRRAARHLVNAVCAQVPSVETVFALAHEQAVRVTRTSWVMRPGVVGAVGLRAPPLSA